MKTFNKRGDGGETSLFLGPRVPKSDAHCEAYGTIDEAVSAMGLARSLSAKSGVRSLLLAAHMDAIGLMATMVQDGFIRFTEIGGVDPRILPGQKVIVHGRRDLPGCPRSPW